MTYANETIREGIFENGKFKYAKKVTPPVTTKKPSPTITDKKPSLDKAKEQCAEIGFTKSTEKFADCVMKLLN